MELTMLILNIIATVASAICAIIAVTAKNEAKQLLINLNNEKNKNISSTGDISIKNTGHNTGFISGISTGDLNINEKR